MLVSEEGEIAVSEMVMLDEVSLVAWVTVVLVVCCMCAIEGERLSGSMDRNNAWGWLMSSGEEGVTCRSLDSGSGCGGLSMSIKDDLPESELGSGMKSGRLTDGLLARDCCRIGEACKVEMEDAGGEGERLVVSAGSVDREW